MKAHTLLSAAAIATMATAASADINLDFDGLVASGAQFYPTSSELLTGSIDTVAGDFILNEDGENFTWCDDLCILIANEDFSDIHMQIGGYSNFGATHRFSWETGSSGDAGTVGGGVIDIGGIDVSGYILRIGNGYASGGNGNWSGAIDLEGSIDYVPAPGALALLGLGGLVARRRRA